MTMGSRINRWATCLERRGSIPREEDQLQLNETQEGGPTMLLQAIEDTLVNGYLGIVVFWPISLIL